MTFLCTYCATQHPDDERSREHVLPETIGNIHLVHRNACLRMNAGLARSVEAIFHRQSSIAHLMRILRPDNTSKPILVLKGAICDDGSAAEGPLFLHNNQLLQGPAPEAVRSNTIHLPLRTRAGRHVRFALELPFSFLLHITGTETMLNRSRIQNQLDSEARRLNAYVRELFADPKTNPGFANFVRDNDIVLEPLEFTAPIEESRGPEHGATRTLVHAQNVDGTVIARYFAKAALLFAAECGPLELLRTSETNALRSYLADVFVDRSVACNDDGGCHRFFGEGPIAGRNSYWWSSPIGATAVAIDSSPTLRQEEREILAHHNTLREIAFRTILPLFRIAFQPPELDDTFVATLPSRAFHHLSLRNDQNHIPAGVWCDVSLFDGIMRASVQLSASPDDLAAPVERRIETPWFKEAPRGA